MRNARITFVAIVAVYVFIGIMTAVAGGGLWALGWLMGVAAGIVAVGAAAAAR